MTNNLLLTIIVTTSSIGVWQLAILNWRMATLSSGLIELYKRVDAHSDAIKEYAKQIKVIARVANSKE